MTNGKGDKRRPGDEEAFRSNYDRIFVKAAKEARDMIDAQPVPTTGRKMYKDGEILSN